MDVVTRDSILSLLESETPPASSPTRVSLFLGTHPRGPEAQTDRLRLEHLIARARADALALGRDREREVDALLEPARQACEDLDFWSSHGHGMALFLGPGEPATLRLSLPLRDLAVVGDRFHVKPLTPMLHGRGRFYVLALSRKRARWIVADAEHAWEIDVPGLPQGVEAVTRYDDPEKTLQAHSGPPRHAGAGRAGDALFHGQGGVGTDDEKVVTASYCRLVAQAIPGLLADERPLVLAGERSLLAQLRRALSYQHLVSADLPGSPDRTPVSELGAKSLPLVRPWLEAEVKGAAKSFEEGATLALEDLDQILVRAGEGRIASLFVASDREFWGPPKRTAERVLHDAWQPGDVDLLDLAAAETLRHRGDVFAVPAAQVPGAGDVAAAVLRY
jgi:hypothetical protein